MTKITNIRAGLTALAFRRSNEHKTEYANGNPARFRTLAFVLLSMALLSGSVHAAATEYFHADFDGTTAADFGGTIGYGAHITESNLNAGTSIGTWTVNQAQTNLPSNKNNKMIQTDGGTNVANKALRFGINTDGTIAVSNAVLTANLTSSLTLASTITVSFAQCYISIDGTSDRITYLTGLDGSSNRLFQIGFVNEDSSGSRLGYFSTAGTWTLIGASGDLTGNNNSFWSASLMKNVAIEVGASTYDIKLAGTLVTGGSGIAFRDAAANGLSKIVFSANNKFTGSAFDNITVTQVPPPSGTVLIIR